MNPGPAMWMCALAFSIPGLATDPAPACLEQATSIRQKLDAGDFEGARSAFDSRMLAGLTAAQLRAVWISLPQQVGLRLRLADGHSSTTDAGATATLPMQHEYAWLDLQIHCDGDGKVSGLWVRPGKPVSEPAKPVAALPDYVQPQRFAEREVVLSSAGLELPATLALPNGEGPHPAVVLVHGSGAHDRDSRIGQKTPLRDLAQGLASHGIASLRYDKRSFVAAESFADQAFTVKEEVIDDAVAAIALLRSMAGIDADRVYVAGHSLGAMLAPRIAAEAPEARGMILLAAPGRALPDIIVFQMRYLAELDGEVSAEEQGQLDAVAALYRRISALTAADADDLTPLLGAPAAYWLDLAAYDPIASTQALAKPTLLLQGDGDYQVTVAEDYRRWTDTLGARDWFHAVRFSGIGHLYTAAGKPPSPKDYALPGSVDVRVIEAIVDWIGKSARSSHSD